MNQALSDFLRHVPEWAPAFVRLDRAAVGGDVNARAKLAAFTWIASQDRTILEKFDAIVQLERLPEGPVTFSLPQLLGWDDDTGVARVIQ